MRLCLPQRSCGDLTGRETQITADYKVMNYPMKQIIAKIGAEADICS